MRVFLTGALLAFASLAFGQSSTEFFCDETKRLIADAQDQMPIRADMASLWVGASAVFAGGKCRVQHSYLVDSDAIIDMAHNEMLRRGMDSTRLEVAKFYQSERGASELRATMREDLARNFAPALKVPGVEIKIHYGASDPIEPFTITLKSEVDP